MSAKSLFLALIVVTSLWAQRVNPLILPEAPEVERPKPALAGKDPGRQHAVRLGALSEKERATLSRKSLRKVTGVYRALPKDFASAGLWEATTDGRRVWRVGIESSGASGIRVEFRQFSVGRGKVWMYPTGGEGETQGPYTGRGLFDNGEFWSGTVFADAVVIEYEPEDPSDRSVPFRISGLSHRAAAFNPNGSLVAPRWSTALDLPLATSGEPLAAACNIDATCYPEWRDSMRMVADIFFQVEENGEKFEASCTGSLIGTSNNSQKPYFLTANHCIDNEASARSIEALWSYQTASCGAPAPSIKNQTRSQVGGHYLLSGGMGSGDYSLLLLSGVPGGAAFAGWDPGDLNFGGPVTGIHHPVGSWKRILFGHRIADRAVSIGTDNLPADQYYAISLDLGIAEPGSSGSPLFTSPGVIAGTLTYGPAATQADLCATPNFTIGYGRFSVAYPALQNYLEDLPSAEVTPSLTDVGFSGSNGKIANNGQVVQLTTGSATPVVFSLRPDAAWLKVNMPSNQVSAARPVPVTLAVDPAFLQRSGTYTTTLTILAGAATPKYVNVRVTMNLDYSDVVLTVTPNPVQQDDSGRWPYVIRLQNGGAPTRIDLLRIDGQDYSDQIADWFGGVRLGSNATLDAAVKAVVLGTPYQQYVAVGGQDELSGQRWYRTFAVTLQ